MVLPRALLLILVSIALVVPSGASAQAPGYDENANWLGAFGRTVDHFSAPDRSVQNALVTTERYLNLIGEAERIPERSAQQAGGWPWNGDVDRGGYDRQGDWTGSKIEFEFANDGDRALAATMWGPSDQMLEEAGLQAPLPGIVYSGGVISSQPMYYWFAQEMARSGYVVMTYDVSGQGRSEGSSTGNAPADLRDALDFFTSTPGKPYDKPLGGVRFNPLYRMLDRSRIGTAGHSMGAGAVQSVGDHCGVVKAISAQSDLRASYAQPPAQNAPCGAPRRVVPIQGQGADYESFIFPPQPSPGTDPEEKLAGFKGVRGVTDVQEIVVESGTHLTWSHVTWAYTAAWSEAVAFHYALGWFDRYLYGDRRRGGRTGTQRVTDVFAATAAGNGVSRKYRSAWSLGSAACLDMLAGGCPQAASLEAKKKAKTGLGKKSRRRGRGRR